MTTTIQIANETREELESLKIHRREPLNDVIARLLNPQKSNKIANNDIEAIKKIAMPILKAYGVKKAAVFGSFARKEANEHSDIDFLVELPAGMGLDVVKLEQELEKALGRKIDLVSYKYIDPYIKERVLKESISIYG